MGPIAHLIAPVIGEYARELEQAPTDPHYAGQIFLLNKRLWAESGNLRLVVRNLLDRNGVAAA